VGGGVSGIEDGAAARCEMERHLAAVLGAVIACEESPGDERGYDPGGRGERGTEMLGDGGEARRGLLAYFAECAKLWNGETLTVAAHVEADVADEGGRGVEEFVGTSDDAVG